MKWTSHKATQGLSRRLAIDIFHNVPEWTGKSAVLYMCNNCLALPYLQMSFVLCLWPWGKITSEIFKMEMVPPWFFRFKVLMANSLGVHPHPPHSYMVHRVDDHTSPQWPPPSTVEGDFHLSFFSWDHVKATEDGTASPTPPPTSLPVIIIFTTDSQQLSQSCLQAAGPCCACRKKNPSRAILDQRVPVSGYPASFPWRGQLWDVITLSPEALVKCSQNHPPWNLTWNCT